MQPQRPERMYSVEPTPTKPVPERERTPTGYSDRVFTGALSQLTQPLGQESADQRQSDLWQRLEQARVSRVETTPSDSSSLLLYRLEAFLHKSIQLFQEQHGLDYEFANEFQLFYIKHIETLLSKGDLSHEAFALWLRDLSSMSRTGEYDRLIRNPQPVDQSTLKDADHFYRGNLVRLVEVAKQSFDLRDEQPDFRLFGIDKVPIVTGRLYFSANLAGEPHYLLGDWYGSLYKTSNLEKVAYKAQSNLLTRRYDTLVAYIDDRPEQRQVAANYERILSQFAELRHAKALAPQAMPTGLALAPGIAYAPEPLELNYFLGLLATNPVGQQPNSHQFESVSYNGLIAALTENALALAQASAPEATQLDQIEPRAKQYFRELLKVSGIDPDSMTCLTLGGQLPGYVKKRLQK